MCCLMDRDMHTIAVLWLTCRFTVADVYDFPIETASRRNQGEGTKGKELMEVLGCVGETRVLHLTSMAL